MPYIIHQTIHLMTSFAASRFLKIAAAGMVLAPLLLLLGDAVWMLGGHVATGTLLRWTSYVAFIPAVIGLTYRLGARGLGLVGGLLCLVGIPGGVSILTLYRLAAVLQPGPSGVPVVIEEALGKNPALPATIFLPGALFPLGLFLCGIALVRLEKSQPLPGLLLSLGGVLFWVGNALDVLPALLACDVLLLSVFTWLARRLRPAGKEIEQLAARKLSNA
jgi:hypothetical protein